MESIQHFTKSLGITLDFLRHTQAQDVLPHWYIYLFPVLRLIQAKFVAVAGIQVFHQSFSVRPVRFCCSENKKQPSTAEEVETSLNSDYHGGGRRVGGAMQTTQLDIIQ